MRETFARLIDLEKENTSCKPKNLRASLAKHFPLLPLFPSRSITPSLYLVPSLNLQFTEKII